MEPWNTACLDWEERILAGRTLVPDLPLFQDEAARAVRVFNRLKIPVFLGLQPQASAFAVPAGMAAVSSMTPIDRLRIAILQVVLAEYPASAFVLNPINWATIELTKDTQGRYIIGNPAEGVEPRLWNLPVVATQAQTQNRFLTDAFDIAAQIFDRMEIEILLSTENVDDFEKNMMTIRAEERLALAVYRPEAFVSGTLVVA